MKKLLTFAHRGEAQAFFLAYSFKPVEFFFDGLFESEHFFLLVTGEGLHNASEKTISVLAKLDKAIDEVFNIGVAGSLNLKLKKNDLIWIRTAYAHHAERLEFKSYSSPLKSAQNDCMSAYDRVLSLVERSTLSQFADLVDRELWAVASAAQLFKLPFYAVKIISDDMNSTSEDICKFVKEEALSFSEKLLKEFQSLEKFAPRKSTFENKIDFLHDSDFYFTTSQERKLVSLQQGLKRKGVDLNNLNVNSIRELDTSPKDRTRILLQFLNDELNPIAKMIRISLAKKLAQLELAGINSNYDPDFEQSWLQLSMKIQSSRDLEQMKNALRLFSYEDFKSVFHGKIE